MSAAHKIDSYKAGHERQYPAGTTEIYSNLTARSGAHSNVRGSEGVCFIGLQHFILDFIVEDWNYSFFHRPKRKVVNAYQRRISNMLGYQIDVAHIEALHSLGFLPVIIKALPEGSFVPYGVPMLTIRNTLPEFFWVTNMLETSLSAELWQPITSATTYRAYRKIFEKFAKITGTPLEFTAYQGHDFSFRGMPGRHAAAISAFAAIAAGSKGSDTIPAIDLAEEYYGADSDKEVIATTINGTEHSVMCAGGEGDEIGTLRRLIAEIYPSGYVAAVCDSWDFWRVVTEYLPALKDLIMSRDGTLVIRPDSGDPVDIICGSLTAEEGTPESKGLIECLWDTFGGTLSEEGYKVLDSHIGAIYGDSITLDRAYLILSRLADKGFASGNIVLGIGSYTYQLVSRDTHGMAMKATNAIVNGVSTPIFKCPKTDSGVKKSAKGYLKVVRENGRYVLQENVTRAEEETGELREVFRDGYLITRTTLSEIREIAARDFNETI